MIETLRSTLMWKQAVTLLEVLVIQSRFHMSECDAVDPGRRNVQKTLSVRCIEINERLPESCCLQLLGAYNPLKVAGSMRNAEALQNVVRAHDKMLKGMPVGREALVLQTDLLRAQANATDPLITAAAKELQEKSEADLAAWANSEKALMFLDTLSRVGAGFDHRKMAYGLGEEKLPETVEELAEKLHMTTAEFEAAYPKKPEPEGFLIVKAFYTTTTISDFSPINDVLIRFRKAPGIFLIPKKYKHLLRPKICAIIELNPNDSSEVMETAIRFLSDGYNSITEALEAARCIETA